MSENVKKALAIFFGAIWGFGSLALGSRLLARFEDEDGSEKEPTKQEETVDKETEGDQEEENQEETVVSYTVLETNIEGDPVGYIEFDKETVFFELKEFDGTEIPNMTLFYGPDGIYSLQFKLVINENNTDMIEGAFNIYSDGEKFCLTETVYLPVQASGAYAGYVTVGTMTINTVEWDLQTATDTAYLYLYYPEEDGGANYTLNVLTELPTE